MESKTFALINVTPKVKEYLQKEKNKLQLKSLDATLRFIIHDYIKNNKKEIEKQEEPIEDIKEVEDEPEEDTTDTEEIQEEDDSN